MKDAQTPKPPARSRRWFLRTAALALAVAAAPKAAWAFFVDRFPVRTVEREAFSFDPASGLLRQKGRQDQPYELVVDGLVQRPLRLSHGRLLTLPQHGQTSDFHCVEGWSVADLQWGGVRVADIAALARPKPEARFVTFHSLGRTKHKPGGLDHYVESFPLGRLLDPGQEVLLALSLGGRPLSHDHGAPLRVVSPHELGYKSIKYVQRMEFTDKPRPGWWTVANPIYPMNAPVPRRRLRR